MKCHEILNRTVFDRIELTRGPIVNPKAKSPYQKYGKREFQYAGKRRKVKPEDQPHPAAQ